MLTPEHLAARLAEIRRRATQCVYEQWDVPGLLEIVARQEARIAELDAESALAAKLLVERQLAARHARALLGVGHPEVGP